MPENAAEQTSKRIREAIRRILAVQFELIRLRGGFATVGITIALGG
jgi:hypothetical protein